MAWVVDGAGEIVHIYIVISHIRLRFERCNLPYKWAIV
jgi:hypothetical protein